MSKQILLNEISLGIATLFLIISYFSKDLWITLIGLAMIIYSANKIKTLKNRSK